MAHANPAAAALIAQALAAYGAEVQREKDQRKAEAAAAAAAAAGGLSSEVGGASESAVVDDSGHVEGDTEDRKHTSPRSSGRVAVGDDGESSSSATASAATAP